MVQVFVTEPIGEHTVTRSVPSSYVTDFLHRCPPHVRCLVNGRLLDKRYTFQQYDTVILLPKVCGGKGGFGSMLRAIGAQIEATTNNDACRDLSGKRLRDVKCEKLLKDWAEKKASEKEDKRERKRQRLQKVLDGPSRIKAEDNTYISEMRSMSDSVETAIATAIAEDEKVKHIKLPEPAKSKKWFDEELDSSSEEENEEEAESSGSGEASEENTDKQTDEQTDKVNEEEAESSGSGEASEENTDKQTDEQTDNQEEEHIGEEKGEIRITFLDEDDEEEKVAPPDQVNFSVETDQSRDIVTSEGPTHVPQSDEPAEVTEDPSGEIPADSTASNIPPTTEGQASPTSDSVNWAVYQAPDELLSSLGADKLKRILSEMGLKCGGTPIARAERLFSIRNLSKEDIPASLLGTSGKGRKR